jgi:dTDP-4-amino-4,6-dideoxygalactose transaminase
MRKLIPHSKPCIGEAEIYAVTAVLKSGMLAQDRETALFEKEASSALGCRHGAAVNSGTAALTLALRALGAEGGDVIIPSFVCSSLYHAVLGAQARPVIADCDPRTFNIDPADAKRRLTRRTRAIIAPHMFGLPCDMDALNALGVAVIEDCAQSFGARIGKKPAGALGAAAAASFYATKLFTTGEGGLVASSEKKLVDYVHRRRDYDNTVPDRPKENCKMTDFQAAMGRVQLKRLPSFLAWRAAIAGRYDAAFADSDLTPPEKRPGRIYSRYVLSCPPRRLRGLLEYCAKKGICAHRPVFRPLHLDVSCGGKFSGTELAWSRALSLPVYPGLTDSDIMYIINAIRNTK